MEKKAQIQKKIESMKREFNFISHLDNQDVAFVLARKKDYYAQLIQRCYRRYAARKKNKQRM